MTSPVARTAVLLDDIETGGYRGGAAEAAPLPASTAASEASAETPTRRELGLAEAFALSPSVRMVEDQGAKIKEMQKMMEDQAKVINDLNQKITLLLENSKKTAMTPHEEENAMLKQEVKDLKMAVEKVMETNAKRAEQEAPAGPLALPSSATADAGLPPDVPGPSTALRSDELKSWDKEKLIRIPEAAKCETPEA